MRETSTDGAFAEPEAELAPWQDPSLLYADGRGPQHEARPAPATFRTGAIPASETQAADAQRPSASERAFGQPVSITYVASSSDMATRRARMFKLGEIVGDDIASMVDAILARAGGRPIGSLLITGHGQPGLQDVGPNAQLSFNMDANDRKELLRLKDHFAPGAVVTLEGCEVGGGDYGERLLAMLATLWGVNVRASSSPQLPNVAGLEGTVVTAKPDRKGGANIETQEGLMNGFHRTMTSDTIDVSQWTNVTDWSLFELGTRYHLLKNLVDGYTTAAEAALIINIFRTSRPAERKTLYRQLESHEWSGDFKRGWLVSDDALWNSLSSEQVGELRRLLNE